MAVLCCSSWIDYKAASCRTNGTNSAMRLWGHQLVTKQKASWSYLVTKRNCVKLHLAIASICCESQTESQLHIREHDPVQSYTVDGIFPDWLNFNYSLNFAKIESVFSPSKCSQLPDTIRPVHGKKTKKTLVKSSVWIEWGITNMQMIPCYALPPHILLFLILPASLCLQILIVHVYMLTPFLLPPLREMWTIPNSHPSPIPELQCLLIWHQYNVLMISIYLQSI